MTDIRFLTLDEVVSIHAGQIQIHGGSPELRDLPLLQSALAMPQASFGGQRVHSDLPSMAAAYLFHLCKNHPFADGNKRVAAQSAQVFLLLNGLNLTYPQGGLAKVTLAVASGQLSKEQLIESFQSHVAPDTK